VDIRPAESKHGQANLTAYSLGVGILSAIDVYSIRSQLLQGEHNTKQNISSDLPNTHMRKKNRKGSGSTTYARRGQHRVRLHQNTSWRTNTDFEVRSLARDVGQSLIEKQPLDSSIFTCSAGGPCNVM